MTRNLLGYKNGTLTGLRATGVRSGNSIVWECQCDCGEIRRVAARELVHAKSPSHPGCSINTITLHPLYEIWRGIIARCSNLKDKNYGGRGITISEEWKNNFEKFVQDIGPRPSFKHSVERLNNDGNYCKENCVWATPSEQSTNQQVKKLTLLQCFEIYKTKEKAEVVALKYNVSSKTVRNIRCHQYSRQVKAYIKRELMLEQTPP